MDFQTRWVRHTRFRVDPFHSNRNLSYSPSPSKSPSTSKLLRSPSLINQPSIHTPKVLDTSHSDLLGRISPTFARRLVKSKSSASPIKSQYKRNIYPKPRVTYEEAESELQLNSFSPTRLASFSLAPPGSKHGTRSSSTKKISPKLDLSDHRDNSIVSEISFYEESKVKYISEAKSAVSDTVNKLDRDKTQLKGVIFRKAYEHPWAKKLFKLIKAGNTEEAEGCILNYPDLVRAVDSTQQTPLHWAARRNNMRMLQFLLSKHADIGASDITGRKPEDIAKQRGHKEIYNYLCNVRETKEANMRHVFNRKVHKRIKIINPPAQTSSNFLTLSSARHRSSANPIQIPNELHARYKRHSAIGPYISLITHKLLNEGELIPKHKKV